MQCFLIQLSEYQSYAFPQEHNTIFCLCCLAQTCHWALNLWSFFNSPCLFTHFGALTFVWLIAFVGYALVGYVTPPVRFFGSNRTSSYETNDHMTIDAAIESQIWVHNKWYQCVVGSSCIDLIELSIWLTLAQRTHLLLSQRHSHLVLILLLMSGWSRGWRL